MAEDYRELMLAAAKTQGIEPANSEPPSEHWVKLNGINFHYLDWGNETKPHVVLLHGGSLTAHTWDMAALLLRDKYHLVALDQRGHGDTDWTPEDQLDQDNNDLMLEDTRQFIEHLGYDHLTLVGMSMGGMNTIRYSARHPERLDAVGIVDIAPETMREGQLEMEAFREATETLSRFEDFLERAQRFMPHRPAEHLRYSLTHSLKQVPEGYTWKQDHRRREGQAELTEEQRAEANAKRAEALWGDAERAPRGDPEGDAQRAQRQPSGLCRAVGPLPLRGAPGGDRLAARQPRQRRSRRCSGHGAWRAGSPRAERASSTHTCRLPTRPLGPSASCSA
jgi:pimeloyl-ACP methyl ester carboxylesterase